MAIALPTVGTSAPFVAPPVKTKTGRPKLWLPERALFTPDALKHEHGRRILERVSEMGVPTVELTSNRITGLRGETERETYRLAKRTLAVVTAPPSQFKLQPIPPSADYQFHLAQGCPAHCQYCYLAGSLSGPPVTKVYANLHEILDNLTNYLQPDRETSFEVSCYTDPLGLEHLTHSLSECVRHFGTLENARLRYVSKFDAVEPLLGVEHHGHTRARASVNAAPVERLEGGTASVEKRLQGLRKLALADYPVGLVVAPIMPAEDWRAHYTDLFDKIEAALDFPCDLTFELITHRFTPGSKEVLLSWYPNTSLDLDESSRSVKRNKFGGTKYVYTKDVMLELKAFFETEIAQRFPQARVLYWT